jgi:hypothetical protein
MEALMEAYTDLFLTSFIGGILGGTMLLGCFYVFVKSVTIEYKQAKSDLWKTAALIRVEAELEIHKNELKHVRKAIDAKMAKKAK